MKVVVAGATGLLGRVLVPALPRTKLVTVFRRDRLSRAWCWTVETADGSSSEKRITR